MDEPSQQLASSFSLQQLLDELESLITLESQRNRNAWISSAQLAELFADQHGEPLADLVKAQGYANSVRQLLEGGKQFSIYGTQAHHDFYVASLKSIVSNCPAQSKTKRPVQRRIKQQAKADLPNPAPEIESVGDLEQVLLEIVSSSIANDSARFLTISALSQKFYDRYGQPIRAVMRTVCSDMTLTELLQVIPGLHSQKAEDGWQVAIAVREKQK